MEEAKRTMAGRPSGLDDLTAERIRQAVRKGATWAMAAQVAGIGRSTLMEWKARGKTGEQPYADFLDRLKRAQAERAEEALEKIQSAAGTSWQAAAWFLERTYPDRFALRRPVERDEVPPTPEEAERLVAEAAKLAASK